MRDSSWVKELPQAPYALPLPSRACCRAKARWGRWGVGGRTIKTHRCFLLCVSASRYLLHPDLSIILGQKSAPQTGPHCISAPRQWTDLEADPQGVQLGSFGCHRRCLGPDVCQTSMACSYIQHGGSQRAAVLVTCHDEVVHNEWSEEQQENDAGQGEPVHFPERRTEGGYQ